MNKIRYYVLDEEGIPKAATLEEWGRSIEKLEQRRIAYYERDGYWVSTIFLGLDHRWGGGGPPLLFETMVFNDVREKRKFLDHEYETIGDEMGCERYSTKDDALIGHERHVKALDEKLDAAYNLALEVISTTKDV